ncbi:TFIIA-domain-containing protein [Martensiomyces pterosporus]|nr:TFIIA-domain-containing protein [Martensiomyces pterosporus]
MFFALPQCWQLPLNATASSLGFSDLIDRLITSCHSTSFRRLHPLSLPPNLVLSALSINNVLCVFLFHSSQFFTPFSCSYKIMSNSVVAAVYRYVIDDVVRNVHSDFEGHGVDTSVLEDLQRNWESKIIQSRVASFPGEDGPDGAVDLDTQLAAGNGTHTASARGGRAPAGGDPRGYPHHPDGGSINSAASLASIINNPESMAPSAASLASLAQSGRGQLLEDDEDEDNDVVGSHYSNSVPPHGGHIPQTDGAADANTQATGVSAMEKWQAMRKARRTAYERELERIGQVDGASDDDDDDEGADGVKAENPEDAINSDLDDSDEEDDYEGGGEETEHIVLCQYDKVTRSKNKWKCVLRDGIMLINGRDYLFQKATGDFEW